MNSRGIIKNTFMLFSLFFVLNNYVYADSQPNIEFENLWIVLPPEVARSTAGYGTIKNTGNASDTLLNIRSSAGTVMLHKTDIEAGMARMIHMTNILIEPGSELVLEPMSFHLMFSDLCSIIFTENNRATILFEFEKSGVIEVGVPILSDWQ